MNNFIYIVLFLLSAHLSAQFNLWSDFEDGTLEEWTNTDASITLLTVENEAGFWFLRKECDGSNSSKGEMAIINTSDQWAGDHWYEAGGGETVLAFVDQIRLRNNNDFDLHIRIGITGSNGYQVVTTTPLIVPAFADWATYEAPLYWVDWLGMYNLTILNDTGGTPPLEVYANVMDMFSDVIEYRVIHNNDIVYHGEIVNGFLEIDELTSVWLLSANETKKKEFTVLPNPFTDSFSITSENININAITIYAPSGAKVLQREVNNSQFIDVSQLAAGIYFIHIDSDRGKEIHRIIKE